MFRVFKTMFGKPAKSRLEKALARLDGAADKFRTAAETCGPPQSHLFWSLAGATSDLRNRLEADPAQITPLRKLIFFFIPKMSELCHSWAKLAARHPLEEQNSAALADFESYLALIRSAERACLSSQYQDLQASMQVVELQLDRYVP